MLGVGGLRTSSGRDRGILAQRIPRAGVDTIRRWVGSCWVAVQDLNLSYIHGQRDTYQVMELPHYGNLSNILFP